MGSDIVRAETLRLAGLHIVWNAGSATFEFKRYAHAVQDKARFYKSLSLAVREPEYGERR